MTKRLYNKDGSVNEVGMEVFLRAENFASKLTKDFSDYDFHDMESVIYNACSIELARKILDDREKEESK